MKPTFNSQRPTPNAQRPARSARVFHSMLGVECSMLDVPRSRKRHSERGIALVITLILLSVTLVMALAFLAVSHREKSSVTTNTDTTTARLAADSALQRAEFQIVANMLISSNSFDYGLLVSTNYINTNGFTTGIANPTNVDYQYVNGNPLSAADLQQNLANLLYSPRAPVFVITNQATGLSDFRFYLDLNRNGRFDETRSDVPNVDSFGNTNGTLPEVGDPQWIGVLERPDVTYGPDNKFLSRFAFIALPVGNTLDVNYIHDQTLNQTLGASDGFFRNQGVGTWEINLAAFLTDLNTNQWDPVVNPYNYRQWMTPSFPNLGVGFEDALSLLSYRYGYNYNSLAPANALFPNAAFIFANDGIDGYSDGSLQTTLDTNADYFADDASRSWAGADNTNHFFTTQEFFDPNKTSVGFTNRLASAGNGFSTYDRYTFYRLLAQLGTDSTPEQGKLNLNYNNAEPGFNNLVNTNGTISSTNFVPWTAQSFFTNAADRMLKLYTTQWFRNNPSNYLATYYGIFTNYSDPTGMGLTNLPFFGMTNTIPAFGLTNIPVQVNGSFVYTPAVNRILQLAANIYDASTNNFYPSVFRPYFSRNTNGDLFVTGYINVTNVAGTADGVFSPPYDYNIVARPTGTNVPVNVYGVPWIIGAKKYMPNFNQFYMLNEAKVTRKLQVSRPRIEGYTRTTATDFTTNQLFLMSITNHLGYSLWNSYSTNVLVAPEVVVNDTLLMVLTNNGARVINPVLVPAVFNFYTNFGSAWPGSAWNTTLVPAARQAATASFAYGTTNYDFLSLSSLQFSGSTFSSFGTEDAGFPPDTSLPTLPGFGLMSTNWLQAYIVDKGHVIDYVQLSGPRSTRNLATELQDPNYGAGGVNRYMWSTNAAGTAANGQNWGVINQIYVSQTGPAAAQLTQWKSPPNMPPGLADIPAAEAAFFQGFFTPTWNYNGVTYQNTNLIQQAPFTPERTMYEYTLWEANDPLVHYLASDLTDNEPGVTGISRSDDPVNKPLPSPVLNAVGDRYQPWGRNDQMNNSALVGVDRNPFNLAYRDPLAMGSDNWDFPTNKYPGVGWLGRVHRGTPWQTVYLKAADLLQEYTVNGLTTNYIGTNTWVQWTGNSRLTYGQYYDAANAAPTRDHLLFDAFTTAFNDNATRGQLSVNVAATEADTNHLTAGLAAWSALFSGIVVPATSPTNTYSVIAPAGVYDATLPLTNQPPLVQLVQSINATRLNTNLYPHQAFAHVGDILDVPALTQRSPFLNLGNTNFNGDERYEWLPQQTLSLLRASDAPRYVIYSYGQTLTPAAGSVVTSVSGAFSGMITNYQVVAETATRAVVRVDGVVDANGVPLNPPHPHIVVESFNVLPPD